LNAQLKRRLFVVSGIIVVVVVIVLAVTAGTSGYQNLTVAQALKPEHYNTRVQVSGQVVTDSYSVEAGTLSFAIFDPNSNSQEQLLVVYKGGVSATFGNQVTAICTGYLNAEGILECSDLVTKCPSKYETATDALTVSQLLGYSASALEGKPLKVTGRTKPGSLGSVEDRVRLVLLDEASGAELPVLFAGALPETVKDTTLLVITGSLDQNGRFEATDIALREE
jgi:cytochrome c-type biogenesis protein CcmE